MPPNVTHPPDEYAELPNVVRRDLLPTVTRMITDPLRVLIGATPNVPTYVLCSVFLAPPELLPTCIRISCDRARKRWSNVRAVARLHDVPFIFTIDGEDAAVFFRHPDYRDDLVQSWLAEHQEKTRIVELERERQVGTELVMPQRFADLERRVAALERARRNG